MNNNDGVICQHYRHH